MPSQRMTLTREGLDDYDYLTLYRKKFPGTTMPAWLSAAMPELLPTGNQKFPVVSQRKLQTIRDRLAQMLED